MTNAGENVFVGTQDTYQIEVRERKGQSATIETQAERVPANGNRDGGDGKRSPEWIKAKILSSSFLVHCRKTKGWSQAKLAEALGVSPGYIGQLESLDTGVRAPLEFLVKAARVTGTHFKLEFDEVATSGRSRS